MALNKPQELGLLNYQLHYLTLASHPLQLVYHFTFYNGNPYLFLPIYVDDIILTGTNSQALHSVISKFQETFHLKDLGPQSYFLGIQATHDSKGLHLNQPKYVHDLLHRVRMLGAKPSKSLASLHSKLSQFEGEKLTDPTEHRHVVGALQYCTLARPYISLLANKLCQHMHSPAFSHWTTSKRVLRYLKNSIDHGLSYTKRNIKLIAYCDSDQAGNPDN